MHDGVVVTRDLFKLKGAWFKPDLELIPFIYSFFKFFFAEIHHFSLAFDNTYNSSASSIIQMNCYTS